MPAIKARRQQSHATPAITCGGSTRREQSHTAAAITCDATRRQQTPAIKEHIYVRDTDQRMRYHIFVIIYLNDIVAYKMELS